jgi:hypothetical protein
MKRILFYCLIAAALTISLFLLLRGRGTLSNSTSRTVTSQSASNRTAAGQSGPIAVASTSARPTPQSQNRPSNESMQQKLESLSNTVQNWSAQAHGRIEFYGKVVDESNQPIKGASVEFVWSHVWPLPEGTQSTNVVSDHDGLFSLTGVIGSSLGVYVSKAGYYYVRSQNTDDFNFSSFPGMTPFQPDPNNPVFFHLRKKGVGVNLITSKHGVSPYLTIVAPKDGTPVWADLLQGKAGSSGQLEIQSWLNIDQNTHRTKSWRLKLIIPGGGFVPVQDEFPFEAPESGYQPELEFPQPSSSGNIHFGVSQKLYYVAFGSPRLYGRLEINASDQTGEVWFQYAINPDGSRYLESK